MASFLLFKREGPNKEKIIKMVDLSKTKNRVKFLYFLLRILYNERIKNKHKFLQIVEIGRLSFIVLSAFCKFFILSRLLGFIRLIRAIRFFPLRDQKA